MTESGSLEESIKHSIRKSGFPEKIVRLPFKPVFESSKKYGVPLKEVLERLKQEKIFGQISGDYIEFRSTEKSREKKNDPETGDPIFGMPGVNNPEDLQKAAQEYLSHLSPEQMEEMRKKVESMSEEDKKNILDMISQQFKPRT